MAINKIAHIHRQIVVTQNLRSIQKKGKMRFELFPGSPTPYLFDAEFHLLQALSTK